MADPTHTTYTQPMPPLHPLLKWGLLAVLMMVAFYIRIQGTDAYEFNNDETMHINIASGESLIDVLQYAKYEVHPPLFYILLHFWRMISTEPGLYARIAATAWNVANTDILPHWKTHRWGAVRFMLRYHYYT